MVVGWLLILFLGPFELFWGVVVVGACVALDEFFRMTMPLLRGWQRILTLAATLLPVMAAFSGRCDTVLAGMVISLLVIAALALHGYGVFDDVLRYACFCGFATVYISVCMAHAILLRDLPHGPFWLTMLVGIVAGSDTGAYYAGRAFGKRKLFPLISPKKTVAGGVGGMVAGVIVAGGINLLFPQQTDPVLLFFVAIVLVGIGIMGDLTESLIKRSVGVKDSGTILFGHGGVLDRIDSLLLTAPVLFYLLHFGMM